MATSSIIHNFIITDPKAAERLAKALEESANDPPMPCPYEFKYLQDPDEIRECMNKFMQANAARETLEEEQRD